MKIIVNRGIVSKQWFFKFVAANGRTLCHSETYSCKRKAMKGLNHILKHIKTCKVEVKSYS